MVYAYLRVSTDKQDGINQKLGIEEFCKKRGFIIDEYFDDEGKSGTLEPEKRELGKLLNKLRVAIFLLQEKLVDLVEVYLWL